MGKNFFLNRSTMAAAFVIAFGLAPLQSVAQTACPSGQIGTWPSCVTSNLHRILILSGGESSDHDPATANNVKHLQHLDSLNGIPTDYSNVQQNATTVLTASNLAKYDAMVWVNVYLTANFIKAAQQTAIQQWFDAGHGLGCYHQCVKVETGPGIWLWYDSLMAQPYTGYAAVNVSGPVFVDSQGVQGGFTPAQYAGQSFTWKDEWYDYQASPRGMPGVKIVLTTKDASFTGTFNSNTAMRADHVLSWTHEVNGGRFYLQGLYHGTINQDQSGTNMLPSGVAFVDSMFLTAQAFLAGYTGCKDSTYWEYSPMATNQGTGACVSPRSGPQPVSIMLNNAYNGIKIENLQVSISAPGKHTVEVFNMRGKKILSYSGNSPHVYSLSQIHDPGFYFVKVMTPNMKKAMNRKIFVL